MKSAVLLFTFVSIALSAPKTGIGFDAPQFPKECNKHQICAYLNRMCMTAKLQMITYISYHRQYYSSYGKREDLQKFRDKYDGPTVPTPSECLQEGSLCYSDVDKEDIGREQEMFLVYMGKCRSQEVFLKKYNPHMVGLPTQYEIRSESEYKQLLDKLTSAHWQEKRSMTKCFHEFCEAQKKK